MNMQTTLPPCTGRARGFTLIEVLVAVLIFALISAAAYVAIDTLLRSREALHVRAESLQQLQKAMARFERDLRQAMSVQVRDAYGEAVPLLNGTPTSIELTRAGFSNPTGQTRARIEHVQWALQDKVLNRASFNVLDRAVNSEPVVVPMLDALSGITLSYYDGSEWRRQWPRPDAPSDVPATLPVAVALELDSAEFGHLRRVVACVQPSAQVQTPPPGANSPQATPVEDSR